VLRLKRGEIGAWRRAMWVFSNEVDTDSTPLTAFTPGAVAQVRTPARRIRRLRCVNRTHSSARASCRATRRNP